MDPLANYILPIGGMELGIHTYDFLVDDYFLSHFESSPHQQAHVDVKIIVDRRHQLFVLDIFLSGNVACICDRCTAPIRLPIASEHRVFLKERTDTDNKTDDIIYILFEQSNFSVSELLYDLFLIAIPLKKTFDCDEMAKPPCDFDILDRLNEDLEESEKTEGSSIWDDIKNELN